MPQIPVRPLDAIDVHVNSNPETVVNDVIHGKVDWMQEPPPPDRVRRTATDATKAPSCGDAADRRRTTSG